MKKLITLCILLFTAQVFAAPTWLSREAKLAEGFSETRQLNLDLSTKNFKTLISTKTQDTLAVVFMGQHYGFIVVSSHPALPPVISYSQTGGFDENSPLERIIKADLQWRIENQSSLSANQKKLYQTEREYLLGQRTFTKELLQWPPKNFTTTGGWTSTKWHQDAPYNMFCPIKLSSGQRSVTGCPSTAMAQILYFHKNINQTNFGTPDRYYHQYTQAFWIDDAWQTYDFLSFESLNMYLDTIEAKFNSNRALTNEEIAAMTLAAGFACKSVYDPAGSGTFSVNQAYDAYQKFGFNEAILLTSSNTNQEIIDKMIDNIKKARPVHLATVDQNWQYGHNVVCDGYREDGFFRLNMGWGGTYDNWYLLPQGFPMGLTVFEGIVADIKAVNNQSEYLLELIANPDIPEIEIIGNGYYVSGYPVPIKAGEAPGLVFQGWEGNPEDLALLNNPLSASTFILMPDRNISLTAKYIQHFAVDFMVLNSQSQPIPGAVISIEGCSGSLTTNQNGCSQLSLPNGTYNFTIQAQDYLPFQDSFEVNGETLSIQATLTHSSTIKKNQLQAIVFPNPTSDLISISLPQTTAPVCIQIIGPDAKLISEITAMTHSPMVVSTKDLNPGIYFLVFQSQNLIIPPIKLIKK